MMLKVNNEFLDFNDNVEVEKRVKLFEQIDETLGDFSYAFSLHKTAKNMKILGNPHADVKDKIIYRSVDCDLIDESGVSIYKGFLRVERITEFIECSFFSGNYNWISLLTGSVQDIDFSEYDTELTVVDITNTWLNTEGVIFPLFDAGALVTRSYKSMVIEDFSGCIFVKSVFQKIFDSVGIKTQGELFTDKDFNSLLLSRMTLGPDDINNRSAFVKKDNNQNVTVTGTVNSQISFLNDYDFPYFDGSEDNFDSSRYTADVKMRLRVDASIVYENLSISVIYADYFTVRINGTTAYEFPIEPGSQGTYSFTQVVDLEAGDFVDISIKILGTGGGTTEYNIFNTSTVRYTPEFLFFTAGRSLVPPWTKAQLVSNVLNLFCCICDYEPVSKILTIDFFENIKSKEPIDLSDKINVSETDYEEFISDFYQSSLLKYEDSDDEDIKTYTISRLIGYGAGEIQVQNDFIEKTGTILESEFKAPLSYTRNAFSTSLERTNFLTLSESNEQEYTSVTDSLGSARFNVPDDSIYQVGKLVRISDSTISEYNGDWVITTVGSGMGFIILRGNFFAGDATGKISKLTHEINNDDGVYLFLNVPYGPVSYFANTTSYEIELNSVTSSGYSFFNLLNLGLEVNDDYKQGLSFGEVASPNSYQRTLIDKSWGLVSRVLNDPVKLKCVGHIDKLTFTRLTPLRPIQIKTLESSNLYYLNSISGYNGSALPCDIELIKLS